MIMILQILQIDSLQIAFPRFRDIAYGLAFRSQTTSVHLDPQHMPELNALFHPLQLLEGL